MSIRRPFDGQTLSHFICITQQTAPWRVPLVRGVAALRINVLEFFRGALQAEIRDGLVAAQASARPVIFLIADDDHLTTGPTGWPGVTAALGCADTVVVNGTGGNAEDYERFISLAEAHRRIAVIETSSAAATAWRDASVAVGCRRVMVLLPWSGTHPIEGLRQ